MNLETVKILLREILVHATDSNYDLATTRAMTPNQLYAFANRIEEFTIRRIRQNKKEENRELASHLRNIANTSLLHVTQNTDLRNAARILESYAKPSDGESETLALYKDVYAELKKVLEAYRTELKEMRETVKTLQTELLSLQVDNARMANQIEDL